MTTEETIPIVLTKEDIKLILKSLQESGEIISKRIDMSEDEKYEAAFPIVICAMRINQQTHGRL